MVSIFWAEAPIAARREASSDVWGRKSVASCSVSAKNGPTKNSQRLKRANDFGDMRALAKITGTPFRRASRRKFGQISVSITITAEGQIPLSARRTGTTQSKGK